MLRMLFQDDDVEYAGVMLVIEQNLAASRRSIRERRARIQRKAYGAGRVFAPAGSRGALDCYRWQTRQRSAQ